MHTLKPVYSPSSWSIVPMEHDGGSLDSSQVKKIEVLLVAAIEGRIVEACTASIPCRPSVAAYLGDEYDPALTWDAIRFQMEMLKP